MKMVSRIGLVLALACVAVPATLMGSDTYLFIRQNPGWSDTLVEDTAVWRAEIMEILADSVPSGPDSFVTTDTAEIHSLGLMTPSESRIASSSWWMDWHENYGANRQWASWIVPGYVYRGGQKRKTLTVGSGTYRIWMPGCVGVRCTTYLQYTHYWDTVAVKPQWYNMSIQVGKTWEYGSWIWHWQQNGTHYWGGGSPIYAPSTVSGDW
jgi:hypothetical protein